MKPHRGTLILVFGILSLVSCGIFGIFAWMMGNTDMREMDAGLMDASGRANTNSGRVCGIVGSVFFAIQLIFVIFFIAVMGVSIFAASRAETHPAPPVPVESTR